jgi:quinol monooxygenase YgiN
LLSGEGFSGKEGFASAKIVIRGVFSMVLRGLLLFLMLSGTSYAVASEQGSLVAGPSPFVLIARLHALPDAADEVVALSRAVDAQVERGEPGMLLHTFDADPNDALGFVWTEVYADSEALLFHLNNADLGAYLEAVSPHLDGFTIELYGAASDEAVAALRATGNSVTHYANVLGYIRDLSP